MHRGLPTRSLGKGAAYLSLDGGHVANFTILIAGDEAVKSDQFPYKGSF